MELLQERGKTHGDFTQNAIYGQHLRTIFRSSPQWLNLPPVQREALDMMATKISRILSGNGDHPDHWDDLIGYATLARNACPASPISESHFEGSG